MDYNIIQVIVAVTVCIVVVAGAIAGLLWFIAKLLINPISEDIQELKVQVAKLTDKIIPVDTFRTETKLALSNCRQQCNSDFFAELDRVKAEAKKNAQDAIEIHIREMHKGEKC